MLFAASVDFSGLNNTPRTAITLGIKTIMETKRIILMASVKEMQE